MLPRLRTLVPGRMATGFRRHRFRLHAMLTTAGCDRVDDPSYDHDGRTRGSFVLLQHTLAGRGRLTFEGREHMVRAGQTMLLRFPQDNRYRVAPGDFWEFFWICLNGREVQRVWRDAMRAGPVARLSEPCVLQLASICRDALEGSFEKPSRASMIAYEVAMLLADELVLGDDGAHAGSGTGIERAVSLCDAEAAGGDRVDVSRLADAAGYSRYHFSRVFAAETGLSPGRYIALKRMEEAVRLLRLTDLPVKQVARQCGFADPNNFAKAFRRYQGYSPRDFRRAVLEDGLGRSLAAPQGSNGRDSNNNSLTKIENDS